VFETFTDRARKVMRLSRQEALRLQREFIETEHILLGILIEGGGVAAKVLRNLNVDSTRLRKEIEKYVAPSDPPAVMLGEYPASPRAKRSIELAGEAAAALGHDVIGTEHLLLGLLRESDGIAARALTGLGLHLEEVRDMVLEVLGADVGREQTRPREDPPEEPDLLDRAQAYLALEDRPALLDSMLSNLRDGRSIALVGPRFVGKTSLLFAMSRAKAGGLAYRSIDHRIFDEFFPARKALPKRPDTVCVVPEAELVTASRLPVADLLDERRRGGERLVLEFRDGGLEAYAARFPDLAKELVRVDVAPPNAEECRSLLESARRRLKVRRHLAVPDAVLAETDRAARARWPKMVAPWGTIITLWKAAAIQAETSARGDVQRLEKDIEELEKSSAPEDRATAAGLRQHVEGLRGAGEELTSESVRQAIGELADRPQL
jgi:ATP-dependent Clp protease ATP-binding subunit ClpA